MDDLEESDLKITEGTNDAEMLSETPESPTQQIGLDPFNNVHLRLTGAEMKKCHGSEFEMENRNVYEYAREKRNAPGNEFDNDSNDKLVINEEECRGNDGNYVNFELPFEGNDNKEKSQVKNRNPSGDDERKEREVEEEMEKSFVIKADEQNYQETDADKEEGELEEGELEDEEEEKVKEEDKSPEVTETKKEPKEPEQKQRKEEKKKDTTKEKDKSETKDKREREERKRKHRDEDERRKKKKKYYSSEEDENQKKFPGREKSYDFDTLLKQEMFLVNSSNPEAVYSTDASGVVNNFPSEYSPFKDGGDSYDSAGSGAEEWDEKPRRRTKRKRRSSRSPSRKNEAICMFYLQGSCKRGNDCPYSHEIAPTRKMELCKFYMMDCCAKKEKCLYMHKDFPCKYYHFGMKCKAGDQCKFSHDSLQEITKNILLKHIELAPKDILGDFPRVSKHNAQTIISITEAKRKGENYETENLESLLVLEGKGFKYLDRALKNVRKKKDGDKKEKERERENKEERERSPKRSKSREEHRDSDKDKEREKEKERDREKDRDKEKREERERDKERYRNRDIRERERTRERRRHRSKGEYPAHKYRGENDRLQQQQQQQQQQEQQHYQQLGRREDSRERDYGRSSLDGPGTSRGIHGQFIDPNTKWYSSDEECDINNTQGARRNQNNSPPQTRRQRIEESSHTLPSTHSQFPIDIDVMYLKNVLSAVQNQSSQNQNFNSVNSGMKEERSNNLWEQNSKRYSSSENRTSMGYMDISNDIKEVFYEEPKESLRAEQFSSNLDTFLQRARSKSLSTPSNYKDDFRETNVTSRDFKFENPLERNYSQNNSETTRDGREKSHHSMAIKRECPSGNPDMNFAAESGRYSREENSWDNRVHDGTIPFNGLPFSSKDDLDFQDRSNSSKGDVDLRIFTGNINIQTDKINDRIDSTPSSIYDFDYRLIDSINSSINKDDNMSTLPFKVPIHTSAKEIDASYKVHLPVVYKLIKVDIPKPDFSKIKINQDDKKIMDDPRLRKMLRRMSLESPASPRENLEASPDISVRSPTTEFKESRDPRKTAASRDPRTEAKAMVRADPRPDPRMTTRADPRSMNPRVDPRIDTRDTRMDIRDDPRIESRDTRMDIRDPILDSDARDSDPRFGNQMYSNGMIDGHSFQQFLNNNLSNPILPDPRGPDPRGKPGLLGAAPSPKRVPVGLAGTINQGMGGNPFLLSQPMGGLSGPYMNDDRGDMMSGSGPPPFSQSHWGNSGGGRLNINDPRLNRDLDMGS